MSLSCFNTEPEENVEEYDMAADVSAQRFYDTENPYQPSEELLRQKTTSFVMSDIPSGSSWADEAGPSWADDSQPRERATRPGGTQQSTRPKEQERVPGVARRRRGQRPVLDCFGNKEEDDMELIRRDVSRSSGQRRRGFQLGERMRKAFGVGRRSDPLLDDTVPVDSWSASTYNQLMAMGRVRDCVPGDGDSMFESIARQLNKPGMNAVYLRFMFSAHGRKHAEYYSEDNNMNRREYNRSMAQLRDNKVWNHEPAAFLAPLILHHELKRKIVLVLCNEETKYFPDDGKPLDDDTIVVVKDDIQEHYDATQRFNLTGEAPVSYGTVESQLKRMGRRITQSARNGNSMIESIVRQVPHKHYTEDTSRELRTVVRAHGYKFPELYCEALTISIPHLQELLEKMMEEPFVGNWYQESGEVIITFFQLTDHRIVVLRNCKKPLCYPDVDEPISSKTIVIVEDDCRGTKHVHYNGTRPKWDLLNVAKDFGNLTCS